MPGEQNVDMTNNGAIIPTTIANRIIKAVKDPLPDSGGRHRIQRQRQAEGAGVGQGQHHP